MHADDDPAPLPPDEPDPGDCCGGGCVNCVFDVYEAELARHQVRLEAWRRRHAQDGPPVK